MTETVQSKQYADSVALDDEEAVVRVLYESVLGLWGVVNNLSRLRPVRWKGFRVTIFGSARAEPGTFAYEEVKLLARDLAAMGCEIVTGGGPGLMQAANEGAMAAGRGEQSIGIRIQLDFEQQTNPFAPDQRQHERPDDLEAPDRQQRDQPDLDRRIDRPACEAGIAIARHARRPPRRGSRLSGRSHRNSASLRHGGQGLVWPRRRKAAGQEA
jgi:hypothetical protein